MIYIACPGNYATGGTELLHQLSWILTNTYEVENCMYYYNYTNKENPINERFEKYRVKYVFSIEDKKENILIIPKAQTRLVFDYKNIKKCIWWMSVDNYFKNFTQNKLKKIIKIILGKENKELRFEDKDITHFVQSTYAGKFLEKNKVKEYYFLSDYLNEEFLKQSISYKGETREDIVLYNPKKGFEFTKKIIEKLNKRNTKIKFVGLENLTPNEIITLGKKSKVYIDFGNHPGKDRFPREAAILGCVVITGKKGSAKYYEDIKIDNEFKFEDEDENLDNICSKIIKSIENYNDEITKFENYRKSILNEYKVFEEEVRVIVEDVL